jgi:uncharacterized protein with WD repeat
MHYLRCESYTFSLSDISGINYCDRVRVFQAEAAQLLHELPIPNVVELQFSPRGTYLSTWERPGTWPAPYFWSSSLSTFLVKLEEGHQHKNLRVFSTSAGEELVSFSQKSQDGWNLQYTISESHAIRLVGQEVQVFRCAEWSSGIVDKLKVDGATSLSLSPGLKPSIAAFVAEKKVSMIFRQKWTYPIFNGRVPPPVSKYTTSTTSTLLLRAKKPFLKLIDHKSSGTCLARMFFC